VTHSERESADVNLTEVFEHYRLTARELWNRGFWAIGELRPLTGLEDNFESIAQLLFEVLVLEQLAIKHEIFRSGNEWRERLRVRPLTSKCNLTLLCQRPDGSFDAERDYIILGEEIQLSFVRYFEWGYRASIDFGDVLVRIVSYEKDSTLVGRDALIKTRLIQIVLPL
jgi:hypothetical protein